MATYYLTPGYGSKAGVTTSAGAITASTTYFYKGPTVNHKGDTCTRVGSYTGTITTGDIWKLAGGIVDGERVVSFTVGLTVDGDTGNDITANIGTTTSPTGIAAASTIFQTVAGGSIPANTLATTGLTGVNGDEYLITFTNGSEVSATYTITIVSTV